MKNWKKKYSLLLLAFVLMGQMGFAQIERTKKVDRSFSGKNEVVLTNRNGPIKVKKSSDGKVHIHSELVVKAKTEEAVDAVFAHYELEVNEQGEWLELNTSMGPNYQRVQTNRIQWIKFGDGPKIKGVHDFSITTTLEVPGDLKSLKLENKYDDIRIEDELSGDLTVDLYSGKLSAKNVSGDLELKMKYSEARLGEAGKAKMDIYDSNLWLGELASVEVESKYSEFELDGVKGDLEISTYDDKWEVDKVGGKTIIQDKYSEFKFGELGDLEGDIYDAEMSINSADEVEIDESKYTEYKFGNLKKLLFDESYDDDVRVKSVEELEVDNSKYTEYRVDRLTSVFSIDDTYDDTVELDWVSSKFKTLYIDGKYTEMDVEIEEGGQFEVNVEMKYGSFEHPDKNVDITIWKEKDSEKRIQGFVGGKKEVSTNFFTVKGYDNDIDWN